MGRTSHFKQNNRGMCALAWVGLRRYWFLMAMARAMEMDSQMSTRQMMMERVICSGQGDEVGGVGWGVSGVHAGRCLLHEHACP